MTILIRQAQPQDLNSLVRILNHFIENTAITFDTQPYSTETRRPWFKQFSSSGRHRCLVAEVEGEIIGYANSGPLRPKAAYDTSVEVSVYTAHDSRYRGIGTELYQALFAELKKEDVHRAHALITLPNDKSVRLHKKFDFKEVGTLHEAGRKFDRYHSVYWMEKHLN